MLINRPDLVIMDEPTNHLDIEMIEWLEHYRENSALSLLLVTHDRYFLDAVCDSILELDKGELFEYRRLWILSHKKAEREAARNAEIDKAKNLYRANWSGYGNAKGPEQKLPEWMPLDDIEQKANNAQR